MKKIPDLRINSDRIKDRDMYDLRRFLYARSYSKNGKAIDSRWFFRKIDTGHAGDPYTERVSLIIEIKEVLEARLESGHSIATVDSSIAVLQLFFDFCHNYGISVCLEKVEYIYLDYCEYLFRTVNKKDSPIKESTAYGYGVKLSNLFGQLLDIPVAIELINRTRLKYPKRAKKAVSSQSDKQNLEDTYKMGSFLVDLMSGITIDAVYGQLPIKVPIRNNVIEGSEIALYPGGFNKKIEHLFSIPTEDIRSGDKKNEAKNRKSRAPVSSINGTKRHSLVSLRVRAEFLVFLAQTGMNSAQAKKIHRSNFKYKPIGDSWEVRSYKNRRGGEVYFKVYKSYKPYIKDYINFINHFFPDSDLLFPWHDREGTVSTARSFTLQSIYKLLKDNNVPWISPIKLRKTRVNWCLRRSSGDADLTSEMHQHLKETLFDSYELPSQQRSMVELTRFWSQNDPINKNSLRGSLMNSQCSGKSSPTDDKPESVVSPNCINPSGCLWCENFRDVNTFDYVWSLLSFRHLKLTESASHYSEEGIPADLVIEKLTEKIGWFKEASNESCAWVKEAEMRIAEGEYHPNWSGILQFLEI